MSGPVQFPLTNLDTTPLLLNQLPAALTLPAQLILQDGGRATDLLQGTVMAKNSTSRKWVPWTSETATDGTAFPTAIYIGDNIPFADMVAGDVSTNALLFANCEIDEAKIVFEGATNLDTILLANDVGTGAATPYLSMTVRDWLQIVQKLVPTTTYSHAAFQAP